MGKHLTICGFLVTVVGGAVGLVAWVSPTSFSWVAAHGGWWWLAGLAVLFALAWVVLALSWSEPTATEAAALPVSLAEPTAHDQKLFTTVLEAFPLDEGTMGWLNVGFFGKEWRNQYVDPLIAFDAVYRDRYFDDAVVAAEFDAFKDACGKLIGWFVYEAGEEIPQSDGDIVHRIKTASTRRSTHEVYVSAIRDGERLAAEVVTARKNLERAGRDRGLVPPLH